MEVMSMNCVDELRVQLPRSEHRDGYNLAAVSSVLGTSAYRFLYAPQYIPRLSTVKKLVDAELVVSSIPVEPSAYVSMLNGRSQDELRAMINAYPDELSYGILKPIANGKEIDLKYTTAYSIVQAVSGIESGDIEVLSSVSTVWTPEREDYLVNNYPMLGAAACAEELGLSSSSVQTKASRMGLRKIV